MAQKHEYQNKREGVNPVQGKNIGNIQWNVRYFHPFIFLLKLLLFDELMMPRMTVVLSFFDL